MTRLFRCKLVRLIDGFPQYVDYIGPFGQWSSEWHVVKRMIAIRRAA